MSAFQNGLSYSDYVAIRTSASASKRKVSFDYSDPTNQTKLVKSVNGEFFKVMAQEYDSWKTTWDNSKGQLLVMWNFFSDNVKEAFATYIANKYG